MKTGTFLMASRQQRTELTIKEKLDIIHSLKNNECSRKEIQDLYKVSKHTINRILLHEDKMRGSRNSEMKRIRRGNNRLVDEAVSKWYHKMVEQNVFVNGPLLRQQAARFARMMNNLTFEPNNGWLWRWQKKENVKFNSTERQAAKNSRASSWKRDVKEFAENISLQSADDSESNTNATIVQPQSEKLASHDNQFEMEPEVMLENDSGDGDGEYNVYDCETSRNKNHLQYLDGGEQRKEPDEASINHETFQDSSLHHQWTEIKEEPGRIQIDSFGDVYEVAAVGPSQINSRKKSSNENPRERDAYSVYGEYIAHRLRASASERDNYEVYVAQHNIDEIIFKLSMGSYARVPAPLQDNENK